MPGGLTTMETSSESPWVFLYTLANRFEADVLSDVLEREGIPFFIRSFVETAYDGLFVPQRGWGQILVSARHLPAARKLIASVLESLASPSLYESLEDVDPSLWEEAARLDPEDVCRRALVHWDPHAAAYRIPFLSGSFRCLPQHRSIQAEPGLVSSRVDFQTGLVLLHYLLEARQVPPSGRWIGEKEIPSGHQFFTGPHAFPLQGIVELVADDAQRFAKASSMLGGIPVDAGDMAFQFLVLPRIPMRMIYWRGDDEFSPAVKLRFDATVSLHLPALDTLWAMVNLFVRHFKAAVKRI
ncbi:DUF3786 domain-containing protein [Desulfosoma sp.]